MNSKEAYECYEKHKVYDCDCKNCKYVNPHTLDCNIQLITDHMCADLAGCYNTIESLKILKTDYEKEIEELHNEIRRLKLLMPVECCISNTLETKNDISLNDLLKLPNVESVNIWFNKKGDIND